MFMTMAMVNNNDKRTSGCNFILLPFDCPFIEFQGNVAWREHVPTLSLSPYQHSIDSQFEP